MPTPSTTPPPADNRRPYADAIEDYYEAGWEGLLPLPAGQKKPVPAGFTGNHGITPSWPDIITWADERPNSNIALRLPAHVIGIDVDAYDQKIGGLVFVELQKQLGALPATWRSTSRDDGTSGIRLYTIPEGLAWPNEFGPGIESIRYGHRYVVAPPSIHPNGGTYRWIGPDNVARLDTPKLDELPALPQAWVHHFTQGAGAKIDSKAHISDEQARDWLTTRGAGAPCAHMAKALTEATTITAGSRHDHYMRAVNRVCWIAGEGHTGASATLDKLRQSFHAAVAGDRTSDEAAGEWERLVVGAIATDLGEHTTRPEVDPCTNPFAGIIQEETWPATTAAATSPNTNASNAPTAQDAATRDTTDRMAPTPSPTVEPATEKASFDDLEEWRNQQRQIAVAQEYERRNAREEANRKWDAEHRDSIIEQRVTKRILEDDALRIYKERTEPPAPPFDSGTLGEILARPPEPPMRMEGIVPWDASTLLVAQRKTGKTTAMLNFARCLLTGEPFLGKFATIPLEDGQNIAMLNFEVSGAQLGRWAHEAALDNDRFFLVNLRGRRNPLGHPGDREALAQMLRDRNVGSVIVDPFGRAFTGDNQNDNGQVQAFLVDLDLFVRDEVGARDLMLAAHAGWGAERSRGASALEDWPDTIITMTRDEKDETKRFIKAEGRDVDIEEDELSFDPLTRTLSLTGNGPRKKENKRSKDIATIAVLIRRAVSSKPGCSKAEAARIAREFPDNTLPISSAGSAARKFDEALKLAVDGGFVEVRAGANGQSHGLYPATPKHPGATYDLTGPKLSTTITTSGKWSESGSGHNPYHFPPSLEGEVGMGRSEEATRFDPTSGMNVNLDTGEC